MNELNPKILYLAAFDPTIPLSGGPARAREYVRFLSQRYTVSIVNMQGNARPPEKISQDSRLFFQKHLAKVAGKWEVPFNRWGCFVFSPSLFRAAFRVIRDKGCDLIIDDKSNASFYGYLLSKIFKVPWIYSSRNVEYRKYLDFGRMDKKNVQDVSRRTGLRTSRGFPPGRDMW